MQPKVLSISELTKLIKQHLEQPIFKQVAVEGEISNFKHHTSGHMYFTLKDQYSRIKAVMFRGRNSRVNFKPKNGDTVVVFGSIGVYEPNGEYQFYIDKMLPQGVGLLHIRFEELKAKLEQEGLFLQEAKQSLPFLPRKIAVITSPTSAAVRDVISVIKRRYPHMELLIIPAVVQGVEGPSSVIKAFAWLDSQSDIDLVIVTRGGGSIEELWTFNDEEVARVVNRCSIPVISGIGHETDFTIVDFVADKRAPTPSAAAEMAVPDYFQLREGLTQLTNRMLRAGTKMAIQKRINLSYLLKRSVFLRPADRFKQEKQRVDELLAKAASVIDNRLKSTNQQLQMYVGKLDSLSPLATLARGYSICQKNDATVVTKVTQVKSGEQVTVRLKQGRLQCRVEKGETNNGG